MDGRCDENDQDEASSRMRLRSQLEQAKRLRHCQGIAIRKRIDDAQRAGSVRVSLRVTRLGQWVEDDCENEDKSGQQESPPLTRLESSLCSGLGEAR